VRLNDDEKEKRRQSSERPSFPLDFQLLTSDFSHHFFFLSFSFFSTFKSPTLPGRRRLEVRAPRRPLDGRDDRRQAGELGADAGREVSFFFFSRLGFFFSFLFFLLLFLSLTTFSFTPPKTPTTSLTIISATAGGLQIVPTAPRAIAYTLQLFFARSPAARAAVDLKLHFAPSTLDAHDATGGATRRELLHEEYVEGAKGGGAVGQSRQGFLGQLRAVWAHRVTRSDVALVRRSPFPVLVLHGRSDLLAPPKRGAALAARLGGAYVELEGAHFLTRERGPEVNALVRSVVGGDLAQPVSSSSGLATNASASALPSLSSLDNEDANYCGGWAVPDPHRDLVPKQGWWRHRVLRGSMTRLSSALTGAGGSMAALAAQASAAASAAAAAASASIAEERDSSGSLSSALSTPLVIDDAMTTTEVPPRGASPAPRFYSPPQNHRHNGSNDDMFFASPSPEPWSSRETSFDDPRVGGTVEWISPPGDGSSGSLGSGSGGGGASGSGSGSGSGSDDSNNNNVVVVLKGAALVSPAGSPPPRHRRHNQHLSFMTKRCSTAEAGTPPPPQVSFARKVETNSATTTTTTNASLFKNGNGGSSSRSPSPSAEPPRTPPSAHDNTILNSAGSFAFYKRNSNLRRPMSDDDLRGSSSSEGDDDVRRQGSQCPFVDPVARGVGAIVDSSYDGDE
jgi:hypothetical protein